jgi:hypothetical protein
VRVGWCARTMGTTHGAKQMVAEVDAPIKAWKTLSCLLGGRVEMIWLDFLQ